MSKMTAPVMDVVRFQESDVIVASMRISGFSVTDNTDKNGTVTYKGVTYDYTNSSSLFTLLNSEGKMRIDATITNPTYGDANKTIGDLFEADFDKEQPYFGYARAEDGAYTWNDSQWTWSHQ